MNQELKDRLPWFEKLLQRILKELSVKTLVKATAALATGYLCLQYFGGGLYHYLKGYPNGPIGLPIIGNGLKIRTEKWLLNSCGSYGAIVYCRFFGLRFIIINDSNLVKHFMFNKKEFLDHYPFPKHTYKSLRSVSGGGPHDLTFALLNGNAWKKRRQYAMSILIRNCDSHYMSNMIDNVMKSVVFKQLDNICDDKNNNGNDNIWYPKELCSYLAFNTIYHANFGHSLDINDPKLTELRQMIIERFSLIGPIRKYLLLPPFLFAFFEQFWPFTRVEEISETRRKRFDEFLNQRRQFYGLNNNGKDSKEKEEEEKRKYPDLKRIVENDKNAVSYVDYVLYLLHYKPNETAFDNIEQALEDISSLFGAGTDTTSTTLEYAIYLLMKHPDIQEKVYNDLKRIVNESNNNNSGNEKKENSLNIFIKSVIFRAFIWECLRISSVAPLGLTHVCRQDTPVIVNDKEKYLIPKNTRININIAYIHVGDSPNEHWKNKQFGKSMYDVCLENWIDNQENESKFRTNVSFVGFGTGKRDCVGQQIAIRQIYLTMAHLILKYQFGAQNGDTSFKIERKCALTAEVVNEIPVVVRKR